MADSFGTIYSTDPWAGVASNQRTWYDPILRAQYRRNTLYTNLVPYATQPMLPSNTPLMVFNFAYDFQPNTDPAANLRYNEVPPAYMDGFQVEVRFERYQWQTAYDKFDSYISYWASKGGNAGLAPLIRERVSRVLTETQDLLVRNAFLSTTYTMLPSSSYTGADQVTSSDKFILDMVDDSILRANTQNVWNSPIPGMQQGDLLCVDSPGQIYDVVSDNSSTNRWIELRKYRDLSPFNKYEMGSYHSSRHLQTNANCLWNCGKTSFTTTITAAAQPQDGAPDPATAKVDGTYKVGQAGSLATHYLTVSSASGVKVGDMVTIHKTKNQAADVAAQPKLRVLGAPRYDEGTKLERRIVAISGNTITLNKPLLLDYATEVNASGTGALTPGSGVYGFVTKGVNLHVSIMIAEGNGVVCGVCVPPRVYAPEPIDLYKSVYRIGFDAYLKYQVIRPEAFEIFVTGGTMREADQIYH
jgi:hypothetical protein